jgi:thiol-disulfide isomerase/thioredoxin
MSSRSLFALLALTALACSAPSEVAAPEPGAEAHISWFDGTVEEAFVLARTERRPLFFYWGAEWCPPCHYLKNKVFKKPEFLERIADFIPVYLDGDTERAQIVGEDLDVQGYPTVIVFSPDGDEVMRMDSGIPVTQYADVLDAALQIMRPVDEVLASVLAQGPANATRADLNLLAFYSWDQDSKSGLEDRAMLSTFRTLYVETPQSLALQRSRFFSLYLRELLEIPAETDPAGTATERLFTAEDRTQYTRQMLLILNDPDLRNANLFTVLYFSSETVELLQPEPGAEREALIRAWKKAARDAEDDTSLSLADRLAALFPRISLTRLELTVGKEESSEQEIELPAEVVDRVRGRVAWAAGEVSDGGELQAVMNTMAHLLETVGLSDEAEVLLAEKMDEAAAPYYFMSWIAGLKLEANEPEEALLWYRKAYDSSRGRYSRFRWGSTYLRRLLELAPTDVETIERDSMEILDELLQNEDAFALGNHSRLKSLGQAYESWNESGAHEDVIARLRQRVHEECARYPEGDESSQRARCLDFLSS